MAKTMTRVRAFTVLIVLFDAALASDYTRYSGTCELKNGLEHTTYDYDYTFVDSDTEDNGEANCLEWCENQKELTGNGVACQHQTEGCVIINDGEVIGAFEDELGDPFGENVCWVFNSGVPVWVTANFENDGSDNTPTCSDDNLVSKTKSLSLSECQTEAESVGATFIYWQSSSERPSSTIDLCHIYLSCDSTRIPAAPGTTMEFKICE